jgi:hypothetical protein
MRSNVFVAWSRKLGRRVHLIGPNQFDAWHVVEFDPGTSWFCERPPIELDLLPLQGKRRPLDFWVRRRSGEQTGIVVHDPAARDKSCPMDLLKRSLEAAKLKCEVWPTSDLRGRATYLRNLKQLQPFVAVDEASDEQLASDMVSHLGRVKEATWSEMLTLFASRFEGHVNAEIARLIHAGRITANLSDHALASNTKLSCHEHR